MRWAPLRFQTRSDHPQDPGGTLVGGGLEPGRGGQLGVGSHPGHPHRAGVGDVGQEGAQGDHHAHPQRARGLAELAGEAAPVHLGLRTGEEDHVLGGTGRCGGGENHRRPVQAARSVGVQAHLGPGRREVEEVLAVQYGEAPGVPSPGKVGDGPEAASPASFQPSKAAISTG